MREVFWARLNATDELYVLVPILKLLKNKIITVTLWLQYRANVSALLALTVNSEGQVWQHTRTAQSGIGQLLSARATPQKIHLILRVCYMVYRRVDIACVAGLRTVDLGVVEGVVPVKIWRIRPLLLFTGKRRCHVRPRFSTKSKFTSLSPSGEVAQIREVAKYIKMSQRG